MTSGLVLPPPSGIPARYVWEATDEEIVARYGVAVGSILRFDLNTSPAPPAVAAEVLAAGTFEPVLSDYPPSDYRRLVAAAAEAYGVEHDEILVGAGADEILEVAAKAFLRPGATAVIPGPTYAMYGVITEQRGARAIHVARRPAEDGWSLDVSATVRAASAADMVWLCSPNNPTALEEPDGTIEMLLGALEVRASRAGVPPPTVVLDEAYAEFAGRSLLELRVRHPNLLVVRTASKAYALAGLRVGFGIAHRQTIAAISPYRPPASVSTISAAVVTAALRNGAAMRENVAGVATERRRLGDALRASGWSVGPSVANFLLVHFGTPGRSATVAEELLRRGLVPRRFGEDHPLAAYLRLTVRDASGNDRLIAAAREIGP